MIFYLAGPMRGHKHFNFPAFDSAREWLRGLGHTVYCPAEHDRQGGFDETKDSLEGFNMEAAFKWDIAHVITAQGIVLLPGWSASSGAKLELEVARRTGKAVYYLKPSNASWCLSPFPVRQDYPFAPGKVINVTGGTVRIFDDLYAEVLRKDSVLDEAKELVHGNRNEDYGHPADDFTRTGRIWGAILGVPDIPPEKVGLCMVGVKLSREVNRPKRDNRVDGAGYFETVELIEQRKAAS